MSVDDWLIQDDVPEAVAEVWPGAVRVPTTMEMDGLFTPEDIANRHKVMAQCQACNEWTEIDTQIDHAPCHNCGATTYDPTSLTSLRTWNPATKRTAKGYRKH